MSTVRRICQEIHGRIGTAKRDVAKTYQRSRPAWCQMIEESRELESRLPSFPVEPPETTCFTASQNTISPSNISRKKR